jgi:uncharacterized membrane protein
MVGFLAVALPPFQVPDEFHHAARVEQVSKGILISPRIGGKINGALYAYGELYESMHFHYEVKHTADTARAAASLNWGMPDHEKNFQNTAQYGPLIYLPQALGVWIGKLIGLNPVWTILEARLLNGLVATMIGFFALRICRRGQALLFTTLLLPMAMSEFGSVSQDALIISLSLLMIALASRILAEERPSTVWEFSFFVAIVVITTLGRPSQIAMAPLGFAFVGGQEKLWFRKAIIAAIGVICIAAWMVMLTKLMPAEPPGASVSGQFRAMISHPLLLPSVMFRSVFENSWWLFEGAVGRLGWLDTPVPLWYTWAAVGVLACAWLGVDNRSPWVFPALIGSITLAAVVVTICAAQYMSWTPVGKNTIDGLQGRYFLSILPLLAWLAPGYPQYVARLCPSAWIVVGAFPVVSLATLPGVIMARFYGSWSDMGLVLKILYFS